MNRIKRDHEHGLPPESIHRTRQLENVEREILPFLAVVAVGVCALLIASVMNRAPSAPRVPSGPAMEFPR